MRDDGLVDDVDGLVGKLPVGDVAVGEVHRGRDRLLGDLDPMVRLVLVPQAADDLDRLAARTGRLDDDRLEAPLEGAVLLDVLAVLVERGGADGLDLAAREGGLEHVGGVDRALGGAGADEGVELVEEEHDVLRLADLLHHRLQPLLELAAVLRAGDQRAQVELEQPLVHQHVGHVVARRSAGRGPRRWRSCPRPGSPISTGLFFVRRARIWMTRSISVLAPDDRVELALAGQLGQVARELVEDRRLRALLGPRVVLVAEERQRLLPHLVESGAERLEDLGGDRLPFLHEAEEQVLGADVVVAELPRFLDGELEHALGLRRERNFAERERLGEAGERPLDLGLHRLEAKPEPLEHGGRDAFAVTDQAEQDVLGADEIVAETPRLLPRQDDDPSRPFGESFKHWRPSPLPQVAGNAKLSCGDG